MFRYVNKVSFIGYGMVWFMPLHQSCFLGHYSWKKGKLPRISHNDVKYLKFLNGMGLRNKLLHQPALDWYPDVNNQLFYKSIRSYLKKHRAV